MPAYAYKAHIDRNRLRIGKERHKELDTQRLTIKMLQSIVGDNYFSVSDSKCGGTLISWIEYRDETDAEYNARIKRLEDYNAEVDRRHKRE